MSVRPTQTKTGYPRRSRQPYPSAGQGSESESGSESGPAGPAADPHRSDLGEPAVAGAAPPEAAPAPEAPPSRAERRAARQMRRTLAIVCGLVVAVCLVLTILIVNMARTRPSGLGLAPASVLSAQGPVPALPTTPDRTNPITSTPIDQAGDATASEGGNR